MSAWRNREASRYRRLPGVPILELAIAGESHFRDIGSLSSVGGWFPAPAARCGEHGEQDARSGRTSQQGCMPWTL